MERIAAIYARQSVEKKDSLSIAQQIERCRTRLTDGESFRVYQESKSGKTTLNRDEFNRMMEAVRAGEISKIIVYRLDRVSRSLADFARMWEELRACDVQFVSCSEEFDTTTAMGDAMLKIAMVFAEMERRIIVQRVTDSYFSLAKRGHNMGGSAPFGYRKVDHTIGGKRTKALCPHPEQSRWVSRIFGQYANTDISIGGIAGELCEAGIQTGRGNNFTSSTLGRLLRSPVYVRADERVYAYLRQKGATINNEVGEFRGINGCYLYAPQSDYTREEMSRRSYKKRKSGRSLTDLSNSHVTLAPHEGIVSAELWLACQHKLDRNKQISCSGGGSHTWMSGLLRCANCGTGITVVNNSRGRSYISCYGRKKHICTGRTYPWRLAEVELLAEEQLLRRLDSLRGIRAKAPPPAVNPRVAALRTELVRLQDEGGRIEEELLQSSSEQIRARWRRRLHGIEERIGRAEAEIAKLACAETLRRKDLEVDRDLAYIAAHWNDPDGLDLAGKKHCARELIDCILVGDTREDGVAVFFK